MTQTGTSNTTGSPSAGGNLAHAAKNDTRFEQLTGTVEQLAAVAILQEFGCGVCQIVEHRSVLYAVLANSGSPDFCA